MRILVVEDERKVVRFIQRGLKEEGYAVDTAGDGEQGLYMTESGSYDALILDIMLPKRDGLSVLSTLRQREVFTPVILLTARSAVDDRVRGLDAGADDYLSKPFAFAELSARVRALLRRGKEERGRPLQRGDLILDPMTRRVTRAGRRIELTAREFTLLEHLLQHPNRVLTRVMIESRVWGHDFDSGTNIVDVHINHLRAKIDRDRGTPLIQTVRGMGYMLAPGVS